MDAEPSIQLHDFSNNAAWLLSGLYGEYLPVSEGVVSLAKDPLYIARATELVGEEKAEKYLEDTERFLNLGAVLRTGGIFRFAEEDVPWADINDIISGSERDLPPCPFPRMWFEIIGDPRLTTLIDIDGTRNMFLGLAVIEVTPCSEWQVLMPMLDVHKVIDLHGQGLVQSREDALKATAIREWSLKVKDGQMFVEVADEDIGLLEGLEEQWRKWWQRLLLILPEFLTHLIHVLGVELKQQTIPRPERRRFHRKFGFDFPQVYEVSLRSAGEPHSNGASDRIYVHRWLVRGHYRQNSSGVFVLPGKGSCSWVRPYIKGPPGAPWKGRPVHVDRVEERVT